MNMQQKGLNVLLTCQLFAYFTKTLDCLTLFTLFTLLNLLTLFTL